tara:strand:+ start:1391 stop:2308 length:918 start_codon:yes stop_codon:yes gene_type:complete
VLGLGNGLVGGAALGPEHFVVQFDGTNDHISIANHSSLNPTAAITVSCWANVDAAFGGDGWSHTAHSDGGISSQTGDHIFVGNQYVGSWRLELTRGGMATNPSNTIKAKIAVSDTGGGSAGTLTASWGGVVDTTGSTTLHEIKDFSGWIHLAMTYDGDNLRLYVNGSNDLYEGGGASLSDTSDDQTVASASSATINYYGSAVLPIHIGADAHGISETSPQASTYAKGAIDEVAIWDAAVDAAGIAKIYANGLNGSDLTSADGDYDNQGDLQGYWKMNEGTGTSVADSSSNSNTGTLRNSPTWVGI